MVNFEPYMKCEWWMAACVFTGLHTLYLNRFADELRILCNFIMFAVMSYCTDEALTYLFNGIFTFHLFDLVHQIHNKRGYMLMHHCMIFASALTHDSYWALPMFRLMAHAQLSTALLVLLNYFTPRPPQIHRQTARSMNTFLGFVIVLNLSYFRLYSIGLGPFESWSTPSIYIGLYFAGNTVWVLHLLKVVLI